MTVSVEQENVRRPVRFFKNRDRASRDIVTLTAVENGLKDDSRISEVEMNRLVDKTLKRKVVLA